MSPSRKGPNQVLCNCEECIPVGALLDNGVTIPGRWVGQTLRLSHEKKRNPNPLDGPTAGADLPQAPTSNNPLELSVDFSSIIKFCSILVIWLHLKAGLGLIQKALQAQLDTQIKLPDIQLPQDLVALNATPYILILRQSLNTVPLRTLLLELGFATLYSTANWLQSGGSLKV
ncbi:hypothetical protein B0H19DRAFT_1245864 [Mycena capillaripes]|nr:hypothetical protein B0H19DRAFT_1245864 [Mycena capillaripes]